MHTLYELDSLSSAKNYQGWIYDSVKPHLGRRILELGSGIGNMSTWLPVRDLLVLCEMEEHFIQHLQSMPDLQNDKIKIIHLDLSKPAFDQLSPYDLDTIVSFNVMEHIEDDRSSFEEQVRILKASQSPGPKKIIVFAPALQFAFGEMDRVYKHYRRYSAKGLREQFRRIDPKIQVSTRYFNVLSIVPWIVQGKIFKKRSISKGQIRILERIIPFWKSFDQLLTSSMNFPLGQSVVCIAEIK